MLHQDTLDHLHILLNYGWDSKSLLSLILIGLPELDERLALRRNRSLHSRLSYRLSIEPLAPDDTADYVRMRLAAVGCNKELFTSDAIAMLHEATSGALRDVDRVAQSTSTPYWCGGSRAVWRRAPLRRARRSRSLPAPSR
jgi:general secretion pathway protein A